MERATKRMAAAVATALAAVSLGCVLFSPPLFQPGYSPLNPQPIMVEALLRVELNHANADALCSLPGLGEAKAAAILEYRAANGPFTSLDQLEKIKGISAKNVQVWSEYLYIE